MSLLDGKYEVLKQHQADPNRTVFEATAPDGTLLRVEWYDLAPEQEDAFERYRRSLKRLKRTGRTAVYDITSRPGARYVAWERPHEQAVRGRDAELEALLDAQGFQLEDALVIRNGSQARLFGLPFGEATHAFGPEEAVEPSEETRAPWWRNLPPHVRSWGVTALLVTASLALAAIGLERRANDRIIAVPDLVGQPVNEVLASLHGQGLGVTATPSPSTGAPGTVLSIEPSPGTALRPGRTLRVSYALPSGQLPHTEVPRLVGEEYPGDVIARLEAAGLELGHVARIAADVPPDAVIAQSATAGALLGRGETVDVLVSSGPQPEATFLPDLVGLDVADARYLAGLAGITADRIQQDMVASSRPPGEVLGQSLAPHRPVPRNEAVLRMIVSQGGGAASSTDEVTPSFVGMDRERALAAVGTTPVDVTVVEALSLPQGVIDQEPPPGAPEADRILLTVNVHPVAIPVPRIQARVRDPQLRSVPFAWSIEPGIPEVTATVYATTLEGETNLVHRERVSGGERVEGSWPTQYPGVVTFRLELNGQPYSAPLRVP